jgi:hypothetical protein
MGRRPPSVLLDVTAKCPGHRLLRRISVLAKLPRTSGIEFLDPSPTEGMNNLLKRVKRVAFGGHVIGSL